MSSNKRGLGRGLDALLGDVSVKEEKHHLQTLPIEYMQRGKYQPRKDINPEKLQELADSIKAQGIIQPIVVRQIAHEFGLPVRPGALNFWRKELNGRLLQREPQPPLDRYPGFHRL